LCHKGTSLIPHAGEGHSLADTGVPYPILDPTLGVPAGNKFKNCPVIVLAPAAVSGGIPIPNVYSYITCGNKGEVKVQVRLYLRTDGTHQDNAFHFTMIED
jgi:hypothetical protein